MVGLDAVNQCGQLVGLAAQRGGFALDALMLLGWRSPGTQARAGWPFSIDGGACVRYGGGFRWECPFHALPQGVTAGVSSFSARCDECVEVQSCVAPAEPQCLLDMARQ